MMKPLRVYVDTSVVGGCMDPEYARDSRRIFTLAGEGRLVLLVSDIVLAELTGAPPKVRDILPGTPRSSVEFVEITGEIISLRDAYIKAQVVGRGNLDDAAHVAAATIARADAILSWNFRHIVRLDKIKEYNQVNLANGYGILTIITPKEVNVDET